MVWFPLTVTYIFAGFAWSGNRIEFPATLMPSVCRASIGFGVGLLASATRLVIAIDAVPSTRNFLMYGEVAWFEFPLIDPYAVSVTVNEIVSLVGSG